MIVGVMKELIIYSVNDMMQKVNKNRKGTSCVIRKQKMKNKLKAKRNIRGLWEGGKS